MSLMLFITNQWLQKHPDVAMLRNCLIRLEYLQMKKSPTAEDLETRRDLEIYVAAELGAAIRNDKAMTSAAARGLILPAQRKIAEKTLVTHASVSEKEVQESTERLRSFLDGPHALFPGPAAQFNPALFMLGFVAAQMVMFVIMPAMLLAFLCRGGFLIHTLGIAIVTGKGVRASRRRTLWRSLISWSPVFLLPIVLILLKPFADVYFPGGKLATVYALLLVYAVLVIWSSLLRDRGLQDRLSGTYLVPR